MGVLREGSCVTDLNTGMPGPQESTCHHGTRWFTSETDRPDHRGTQQPCAECLEGGCLYVLMMTHPPVAEHVQDCEECQAADGQKVRWRSEDGRAHESGNVWLAAGGLP